MFHPRSSTIVACASRDDREEGHQKRVVESVFFELSNDLVDSFGEDTSSKEEEVWRGTMIDTFVDMHSSAGRPDLTLIRSQRWYVGARGGKGSKGPTQFPEICRKTGLSERSRVRNKLSPGNASTAFSFSPPFSGRIFKLSSFAANFEYKRRDRA